MAKDGKFKLDLRTVRRGEAVEPACPGDRLPLCPLCDRPIPPDARASRHHLTPKLKGGAKLGTVLLHQICHSAVHARFSEAELARRLNEIASLKQHPALAEFLAWVRTKPDHFHARTASVRRSREGRSDPFR